MRVLIACEYSGRTREAFRARGHQVLSCDLLPAEDNSPYHVVGDVFDVIKNADPFDLMVAHPPCQYLANSGVRWLKKTPSGALDVDDQRFKDMLKGAQFFADLLMADIPKIAVENPIQHEHARRAIAAASDGAVYQTHYVQPWMFGDRAFKATGFTLKGLPPLVEDPTRTLRHVRPPRDTIEYKAWSQVHNESPGPDRWKNRSRTFEGIATAMAETWG